MILDERTEFCDAVALNTGAAGTYLLGDQIDLGVARDIGAGQPLYLVVTVDTGITLAAPTTGTATGTVSFSLASDASAAIATDGTATVHATSAAWATSSTTDIPAGTVLFAVALPMEGAVYERYLGILQTTGTTAINAGKINAFLTHDVAKYKAYADAI